MACNSSFDASSSSFEDCNSSEEACSSSEEASSSSLASSSSTMERRRESWLASNCSSRRRIWLAKEESTSRAPDPARGKTGETVLVSDSVSVSVSVSVSRRNVITQNWRAPTRRGRTSRRRLPSSPGRRILGLRTGTSSARTSNNRARASSLSSALRKRLALALIQPSGMTQ